MRRRRPQDPRSFFVRTIRNAHVVDAGQRNRQLVLPLQLGSRLQLARRKQRNRHRNDGQLGQLRPVHHAPPVPHQRHRHRADVVQSPHHDGRLRHRMGTQRRSVVHQRRSHHLFHPPIHRRPRASDAHLHEPLGGGELGLDRRMGPHGHARHVALRLREILRLHPRHRQCGNKQQLHARVGRRLRHARRHPMGPK